jgi:uridylate kinase
MLESLCGQIRALQERGVAVAVVVGGGNLYRGRRGKFSRETGDRMGMLATAMNGLALGEIFTNSRIPCRIQCALPLAPLIDPIDPPRAREALEKNQVVIFCGGTGLPYFTTDTAAALRALDIGADVLLKASTVDGVYDADPRTVPDARRYGEISYEEALQRRLSVMDGEAFSLCQTHRLPVIVFDFCRPNAILEILAGERLGTLVH